MEKQITYILPLLGRYEELAQSLYDTIESLKKIKDYIKLIVVLDGENWSSIPLIQMLKFEFEDVLVIEENQQTGILQILYDKAISEVDTRYIYFGMIGNVLSKENIEAFMVDPSSFTEIIEGGKK
ncbi:MAG: hypothetical protein A2Y24_06705 [Clostridiales bacterium GWE2_32_10]|nr:MAG: hypothetical protein A2Y24_06705 [Clostridiales bacterium GWE2_32_10]HBY19865.1 hypothetical protein [Clostridiales bacterium]